MSRYQLPREAIALGELLAAELIKLGATNTPCHRIQFKCGSKHVETDGGGMNEPALASFFAKRIALVMDAAKAVTP
jgi:hypothetical protein